MPPEMITRVMPSARQAFDAGLLEDVQKVSLREKIGSQKAEDDHDGDKADQRASVADR